MLVFQRPNIYLHFIYLWTVLNLYEALDFIATSVTFVLIFLFLNISTNLGNLICEKQKVTVTKMSDHFVTIGIKLSTLTISIYPLHCTPDMTFCVTFVTICHNVRHVMWVKVHEDGGGNTWSVAETQYVIWIFHICIIIKSISPYIYFVLVWNVMTTETWQYIESQHKKASNHHANLPLEMYSFTL